MKFNGVDIRSVHPALSINKEIPPGMAKRSVVTVSGNQGETMAGVTQESDKYTVRVNIAGKSKEEAWRVRALLAAWATSSGEHTAQLEPTHWRGKVYDAIVESISPPEFTIGHAMVDVVFALPHPYAHDTTRSGAKGAGEVAMQVGGTRRATPVIRQAMAEDAETLVWTLDGAAFMRLDGAIRAGAVIEADFGSGSLTIDGEHMEPMINFDQTTWQPGFTPGRHTLASTDAGEIEARWHSEWI